MTTEEKNIRICESLGWKWFPTKANPEQKILALSQEHADTVLVGHSIYRLIPNHFNDLNAMHKAEKRLTDEQYLTFSELLADKYLLKGHSRSNRFISAHASERAEAYGLIMGLWKEGE